MALNVLISKGTKVIEIKDIIIAIILGIVEGLTEFLPVSSTGHLILAEKLLGHEVPKAFDTMIQLGAILAICVIYFEKLWGILISLPTKPQSRQFASGILIAFLPSAILGFIFHDFIKTVLFSPIIVSVALIIGGVIIILAEKFRPAPAIMEVDDIGFVTALKIGLVQCVSMIPGVSRSGATIIGAMLMKVERKAAAEFSFFLAIPTMIGVFVYDAYKNRAELLGQGGQELMIVGIGFVISFISAIIVVKAFMAIVTKYGFVPFAYYRIVAGILMLAIFLN
ncbi:MAG: undecaprenyl-diphosphatase [Hyphomonadaceae bacterium]|nr:MAG: undecaprenyl-diphosphatase [Hyphomonadaceae bacterium]